MMKEIKSIHVQLAIIILSVIMVGCKSQSLATSVPFDIDEKTYFYWIGGKQGTEGTTIRLVGRTQSLNVSFSKLYFQNHEYDIVPEFSSQGFSIEGTFSKFREKDVIMHKDPAAEYGNQPSKGEKKIPFDLKDDEAVLLYSINGMEGYHKISGIKQLDKVYMP
jgi:hypothetical protein